MLFVVVFVMFLVIGDVGFVWVFLECGFCVGFWVFEFGWVFCVGCGVLFVYGLCFIVAVSFFFRLALGRIARGRVFGFL